MRILPYTPFIPFMVDSLLKLSRAKRFEIWRRAKAHLNKLEREGKEINKTSEYYYAVRICKIAESAYFWDSDIGEIPYKRIIS